MITRVQRQLHLAATGLALLLVGASARADAPPRLLFAPEVELPPALRLEADTTVQLELDVDAAGSVTAARVLRGLGEAVDALVLEAARRMRFSPAERGGQAVPSRLRFRFRLHASSPPPAPTQPPPSGPPTPSGPPAPAAPGANAQATRPRPPPPQGLRRRRRQRDDEVVVRSRTEPGAATRMSFRAEELLTVPGTFGEPTRVVATLPGVARTPFGLGFFVVRGASFENTGFFVDGYPVLLLYHLGAGPAILSSRLVGQMDFYPGGYPVQFGRFSAGVISLETRPPPTERPRMEVEIDLLRASALGVVPFADGRGTLAVAVRRSYYDALLPLLQPGVSVSFGDAQVRADYRFSEAVRASLFWFGSMDTFDRTQAIGSGLSAATARDALSYNFWRGIGRVEVRSPSGASGYVSAMVGWDDIGLVQSNPGRPDTGVRANGATMGLRAQVRAPAGPVLTASGGVDILAYSYAVSLQAALASGIGAVPMPQSNPTIAGIRGNVTQFGIAPWLEAVLRSGPMEFTAGARAEALGYQGNQFLVGDPRAVLRVRAHPRLTVVGASGWFHQAPTFFSLLDGAGNPNLLPQRAWQSSVGVELDLPLNLELRLTGFFNSMWQLQRATYDFVPSSGSSGGAMRALLVSDGQGRSYGLEVLLRRRLERGLYGWLSYTLSRSERFLGEGRVVPFTFDQTHVLNIALSYEPIPALRFGARFQLATGSPTSLVRGSIYDADADGYRPVYTSEADRLPTYHQLDVRADYRFRLGPLQMSTYLDVLNVYYAQNAEGWVYQYDYADRRTRPGLPILPTVGIRGEL